MSVSQLYIIFFIKNIARFTHLIFLTCCLIFCKQPVLPDVSPEPLVAPNPEHVRHNEEERHGSQRGRPGLQPPVFLKLEYFKSDLFCGNANPLSLSPSHLLLAPVGVLHPRDQVPALSGDGLQGVDEVVGPVRAAAADLF